MLKKRPDGFHEIASLFQAVDLCDTLTIDHSSEEDSLSSFNPTLPTDHTNLIMRAASLFKEKTGCTKKFAFTVEKRIPMEAGLGGGSSNAATTLWGLNQLTNSGVDDSTLAKWGAEIGSDVSFFFSNGTAYCEGRGELLMSVSLPQEKTFWLAKPKEGLTTPLVYKTTIVDKLQNRDPTESLGRWLKGESFFFNDLEKAAFTLLPSLSKLRDKLQTLGFDKVHMTGSGTVFVCEGDVEAPSLPGVTFFPVKTLTRRGEGWY